MEAIDIMGYMLLGMLLLIIFQTIAYIVENWDTVVENWNNRKEMKK